MAGRADRGALTRERREALPPPALPLRKDFLGQPVLFGGRDIGPGLASAVESHDSSGGRSASYSGDRDRRDRSRAEFEGRFDFQKRDVMIEGVRFVVRVPAQSRDLSSLFFGLP
jgi:hypothetical protein